MKTEQRVQKKPKLKSVHLIIYVSALVVCGFGQEMTLINFLFPVIHQSEGGHLEEGRNGQQSPEAA